MSSALATTGEVKRYPHAARTAPASPGLGSWNGPKPAESVLPYVPASTCRTDGPVHIAIPRATERSALLITSLTLPNHWRPCDGSI